MNFKYVLIRIFYEVFLCIKGKLIKHSCSDLLEHSVDASSDAVTLVTFLIKKFQELAIESENQKAFVSDGASVMACAKGG